MTHEDFALIAPHLRRVDLATRQVLAPADQPIDFLYFLEGGVVSIVLDAENGNSRTEVGIVGYEGLSSTALVLGSDRSPHEVFVQVDGMTALRIETEHFRAALSRSTSLRALLLRYVQAFFVQVAGSSVANAHYRMEARLARWLLMCHDRVEGDVLNLTHEFMSMMIGAQRTGVTVTLHFLEGTGAIRSTRGRVTIADRAKLEEMADDAYGTPESEYRRLIAPFGKSVAMAS